MYRGRRMNEQLTKVFEVISNSQRLPVIFAGSGISMRYTSNKYDWKDLLIRCIAEYDKDPEYRYKGYLEEVKYSLGVMEESKFATNEKIGSLVERDFNMSFYRKEISGFEVKEDESPLKVFIANLLNQYELRNDIKDEIELLVALKEKMLTVITTNYDTFFEDVVFTKHEKIIGQQVFKKSELGSIMKIHGCVTDPGSLILTSRDYERFSKKRKVLSAKIINLFTENPVIFMGYSVSDENIKTILMDIFQCLESDVDFRSFEERLIIVVYDEQTDQPVIGTHSMDIDGISISMTKITLSDFTPLLLEMNKLRRITRLRDIQHIKDLVYDIVESEEGHKGKLINLVGEDEDYDGDDVVVAITKKDDMISLIGAKSIDRETIIRDIVFDDMPRFQNEKWIIEYTLPNELKRNSFVPVHKYLSKINVQELSLDPRIIAMLEKNEIDFLTNSIMKYMDEFEQRDFQSIQMIYDAKISNYKKMTFLVLYAINCTSEELRKFVEQYFEVLHHHKGNKTYLNKLVMMLDIKENKSTIKE
jgi:SIR2-like domain